MASSTSRMEVLRGRPPGYTGIKGWTKAHCSSLRSLGYRWVRIPHFTQLDAPYRTDSKLPARWKRRCNGKIQHSRDRFAAAYLFESIVYSVPFPGFTAAQ